MLVIGHRGASRAALENTAPAFMLAEEMGADGVELDVRLTADGRLLVKHDPLPSAAADLVGLPTFADVLTACGQMLVNVEIKNSPDEPGHDPTGALVDAAIDEMRRHGATSRWIISSFDWDTIQQCRAAAPDIMTAYLVMDATPSVIEQTASNGHAAIHPWEGSLDAAGVERCHLAGLAVNTWTCNDPARLRELEQLGVDGVCTDVPDVALAGVSSRPAGPPRWGTQA